MLLLNQLGEMFSILYYSIFALYLILFAAHICGLKVIEKLICAAASASVLFVLVRLYAGSGNLPVFNIFESFMLISFILSVTGFIILLKGGYGSKVLKWIWMENILLVFILLAYDKESSLRLYVYQNNWVILFHSFRCISLALMLIATAYFIQFIIQREMDERTSLLSHMGRNSLLLSAVFFLSAEYVGTVWCQAGQGDFWMWSQTFFQSTLIVLYLMLAFHIPGKSRRSEDFRCIVGGLSGVFMLTLTVIRSLF